MRIAHCSDLHLLSLAGARVLDFANKRWIGGLNLLANRGRHYHAQVFEAMVADFNRSAIDHVVVTGDVTNLAFEEEFRFARRFFDSIELGPEHVTVLPGNHDAYVARGAEYFAEHFDSYNRPDAGWEWSPVDGDPSVVRFPRNRGAGVRGDPGGASPSARWPVVRVRGSLAVIALSTSLATPWFTAYGRVGPAQLARLEAALSDPRLAGRFRLVAIHHPPAGARAASVIRGLKDRSAFADVLAKAGAELVLHGHEHLDLRGELPGPSGAAIPVRGIQSGSYEAGNLERRARYRIYQIAEPAGPGSRPTITGDDRRVWDPERRRFVPEAAASTPPVAA